LRHLWSGRFSKNPKKNVLEFNSKENIEVDEKLVQYDILGSIAHVKMLKKQKILKPNEADEIIRALHEVLDEWKEGRFKLDPSLEDVHMNVEVAVSKKTPHGKKMHTARSRNDQVNLDMRLYMRDKITELIKSLKELQKSFKTQAKDVVTIPAHTHTRIAQPITNKFLADAYVVSFEKDIERLEQLYKRVNKNPLGACAIAGTTWNIDRDYTAKLLGFEGVEKNALETINSRGELEAELAFICALISTQFSRIAEDLIWLSYVDLVELPEEYCTGSSIMPNKMNPDVLELIRGRSGRVYGNLISILTILKGTPTGHNADTQETKRAVIDSIETLLACASILAEIIERIKWKNEKCEELIRKGYGRATLIADELTKKGMPFREAHEKVGKLIKKLQREGKYLEDLNEKEILELLQQLS
jgi:argininosuccinate lyase